MAGNSVWEPHSLVDPDANTVTAYALAEFGTFGLGTENDQPTAINVRRVAGRGSVVLTLLALAALGAPYFRRQRS